MVPKEEFDSTLGSNSNGVGRKMYPEVTMGTTLVGKHQF